MGLAKCQGLLVDLLWPVKTAEVTRADLSFDTLRNATPPVMEDSDLKFAMDQFLIRRVPPDKPGLRNYINNFCLIRLDPEFYTHEIYVVLPHWQHHEGGGKPARARIIWEMLDRYEQSVKEIRRGKYPGSKNDRERR